MNCRSIYVNSYSSIGEIYMNRFMINTATSYIYEIHIINGFHMKPQSIDPPLNIIEYQYAITWYLAQLCFRNKRIHQPLTVSLVPSNELIRNDKKLIIKIDEISEIV